MGKSYDVNFGKWGPFNKNYYGILHVADSSSGTTFNVEVFPGYYRRSVLTPITVADGGAKILKSNASLTEFTYRYELEWKDKVYCDVTYLVSNDKRVDITCKFVNNSSVHQTLNANACFSLQPQKEMLGSVPLGYKKPTKPLLKGETYIIDAVDYEGVNLSEKLAKMSGGLLGERVVPDSSGNFSTAISGSCFYSPEHFLAYSLNGKKVKSLGVRYIAEKDATLTAVLDGKSYTIPLSKTNSYKYAGILVEETLAKTLTLIPNGAITLDCVCYGDNAQNVAFKKQPVNLSAKRTVYGVERDATDQPIVKSNKEYLKLHYKSVNKTYYVKWNYPLSLIRRFYCDDIGQMLNYRAQDNINHWWRGVGDGVYDNVLCKPVFLAPGETKEVTFTVIEGGLRQAKTAKPTKQTLLNDPYAFSIETFRACVYLNNVYPIYSRRGYIHHDTPARFFNCLYTWDSGMIGIGLATTSFERAFDTLNAYLTPEGDIHSPFIMSGSTVPTQVLLYKYLFDTYPEKRDKLKPLYPMVKQIYSFYAGLNKNTEFKTNLLTAFKLNYNSGGWDDYPPQRYLQLNEIDKTEVENYSDTVPVITTSITVLIAKILREIALYFGFLNDYDETISLLSSSIEKYLWNEETGYYSYLVHDKQGNPKEFLKHPDGSDYNLGFDGAYPVVAGVSSEERRKRVLENVKDGMLTEYGLSVVDTRASYYKTNGYWNGSVWVPHAFILWASLLDQGEIELASNVALKHLNTWKKEVEESYNFYEHFLISANGRGAGVHNFSGLSSPMLNFYGAYFTKNFVSCGFETLILSKTESEIEYSTTKDNAYLLVCTDKENFFVNGKPVKATKSFSNAKYLPIPKGKGKIEIK